MHKKIKAIEVYCLSRVERSLLCFGHLRLQNFKLYTNVINPVSKKYCRQKLSLLTTHIHSATTVYVQQPVEPVNLQHHHKTLLHQN